jgi:hypothetical protein
MDQSEKDSHDTMGNKQNLGNTGNEEINNRGSVKKEPDYYWENGFLVFTSAFLKQRGWCCGNGCRHCPYSPKHSKGNKTLA